jgi:PBP1b-binding outer membrane lipoprotein LpoB
MYFKVALVLTLAFIVSGCATSPAPKPKVQQDLNKTVTVEETVVMPIVEDSVKEIKKKPKLNKYNLKPEPFSLESNENDPELLGPQSTLNNGLKSKLKDEESNSTSESI